MFSVVEIRHPGWRQRGPAERRAEAENPGLGRTRGALKSKAKGFLKTGSEGNWGMGVLQVVKCCWGDHPLPGVMGSTQSEIHCNRLQTL